MAIPPVSCVYLEAQLNSGVFRDDYNQPKINEGFVDDVKYMHVPYRHLDDWFLCRCGMSETSRVALPAQPSRLPRLELHGTLVPSKPGHPRLRIKIPILKQYVVDLSLQSRGLWIESPLAWYKLQRPSTEHVVMTDGFESSSQEELHLPLRAKFGLLSNLSDLLNVDTRFSQKYYLFRSPEELHRLLCPDELALQLNPELMGEPFDLSLLRREAQFAKRELKEWVGCGCTFWKGLEEMRKNWVAAKKEGEEWALAVPNYLDSALKSESRGRRLPWGDPDDQPRPDFSLKIRSDLRNFTVVPEDQSICGDSEWVGEELPAASEDEGHSDDEYASEESESSEDEGNDVVVEEDKAQDQQDDSDMETFFSIPKRRKDYLGTALKRKIAPCSTRLAPDLFLKEKRARHKRRKTAALDRIQQEERKKKKERIDNLKKILGEMRQAKEWGAVLDREPGF